MFKLDNLKNFKGVRNHWKYMTRFRKTKKVCVCVYICIVIYSISDGSLLWSLVLKWQGKKGFTSTWKGQCGERHLIGDFPSYGAMKPPWSSQKEGLEGSQVSKHPICMICIPISCQFLWLSKSTRSQREKGPVDAVYCSHGTKQGSSGK